MANFFDEEQTAGNFFDEPVAATPKKPNTLTDVAKAVPSGLVRGTAETAMLPITLGRGAQWLTDNTVGRVSDYVFDEGIDPLVRSVMGKPQLSDAEKVRRREGIKAVRNNANPFIKGQDKARAFLDENLYQPKTTPGEYARTIAEFAAPGGVMAKGASIPAKITSVLAPAITSETAGQAFKGSSMEGPARLIGGLAGGFAGAGVTNAMVNAPETAVRGAMRGVTPSQFDEAARISGNAAGHGINLTGPQAVQQATSGATKLGALQRITEGTQRGGAVMQPYFAPVPQQVEAATGRVLDSIAPAPASPSTLGPRAAETAGGFIDDARAAINKETAPLYKSAEATTVADDMFAPMAADPVYAAEVKALRADPYSAALKDMPDNSVGVIDEVKQRLNDAAETARASGANNRASQAGAKAAALRDVAADASPEYGSALNIQASRRQDVLTPLEQGPIGRIAKSADTRAVSDAMLPKQPLAGSEQEVAKTIMMLGEKDPDLAAAIMRQTLADSYDQSAKKLVGGENYYGGARFAKDIAGSPQQEINLGAALRSLPGQRNPGAFSDYLEVLRATGKREPIGTHTAFTAEAIKDLGTGSAAQRAGSLARTLGASFLTNASDVTSRLWLGKNVESLADMFTDPRSVDMLRDIATRADNTPFSNAATQAIITAPQQGRDRPTEEELKKRKQPTRIEIAPSKEEYKRLNGGTK